MSNLWLKQQGPRPGQPARLELNNNKRVGRLHFYMPSYEIIFQRWFDVQSSILLFHFQLRVVAVGGRDGER